MKGRREREFLTWLVQELSKSESEVAQLCPTLCDPMDCSPSGSSDHGIFQARLLEWVAISFSSGSSQPRDRTRVSRIEVYHFILGLSACLYIFFSVLKMHLADAVNTPTYVLSCT